MRASRVDNNQKEVVEILRRAGAVVKHVHTVKNLFDIIVFYNGQIYCVEIKDGSKPPSSRKLTLGELQCKEDMESVGVKYWVVHSMGEALEMIKQK